MSEAREILSAVGKVIYEHLCDVYSGSRIPIRICVDPFIYLKCVEKTGYTYKSVIDCLKSCTTNHFNEDYVALAIVSFQTSLTYEIDADDNSFKAKYLPFITAALNLKNTNEYFELRSCTAGYTGQDKIWHSVANLFKSCGRILDLGKVVPHEYAYRYVQYPHSQRIMSVARLWDYANYFIEWGIKPNQFENCNKFIDRIAKESQYAIDKHRANVQSHSTEGIELFNRLLYSFYTCWDGSPKDIIDRTYSRVSPTRKDEYVEVCFHSGLVVGEGKNWFRYAPPIVQVMSQVKIGSLDLCLEGRHITKTPVRVDVDLIYLSNETIGSLAAGNYHFEYKGKIVPGSEFSLADVANVPKTSATLVGIKLSEEQQLIGFNIIGEKRKVSNLRTFLAKFYRQQGIELSTKKFLVKGQEYGK